MQLAKLSRLLDRLGLLFDLVPSSDGKVPSWLPREQFCYPVLRMLLGLKAYSSILLLPGYYTLYIACTKDSSCLWNMA